MMCIMNISDILYNVDTRFIYYIKIFFNFHIRTRLSNFIEFIQKNIFAV